MQLTRPLYNLFRNERCGATYRKYLVAETSRKHRTDLNAVIAEALALLPEGEFLVCHHTPTYQCSLT